MLYYKAKMRFTPLYSIFAFVVMTGSCFSSPLPYTQTNTATTHGNTADGSSTHRVSVSGNTSSGQSVTIVNGKVIHDSSWSETTHNGSGQPRTITNINQDLANIGGQQIGSLRSSTTTPTPSAPKTLSASLVGKSSGNLPTMAELKNLESSVLI